MRRSNVARLTFAIAAIGVASALVSYACGSAYTNGNLGEDAGTSSDAQNTSADVTPSPSEAATGVGPAPNDAGCDDGGCVVTSVGISNTHGCAAIANGELYCWGTNVFGEIQSPPSSLRVDTAVPVSGLPEITRVSVAIGHSCALDTKNGVWCWGVNYEGELGHAPGTSGDVVCGTNWCNPTPQLVSGVFALSVVIGHWNTCAITTTHGVACWGWAGQGLVGPATPMDIPTPTGIGTLANIDTITVSSFPGDDACAIDSAGRVWCWGNNGQGSLAHTSGAFGDSKTCSEPDASATAVCNNTPQMVTAFPDAGGGVLTGVTDVTTSWTTCITQSDAGTVSCWGQDQSGEYGNGITGPSSPTITTIALPNVRSVRGGETMCALLLTGDVWCWGMAAFEVPQSYGDDAGCMQFGGEPTTCVLTPVKVSGVSATGLQVVQTGANAIAITTDGHAIAWGNNLNSQLGHASGTSGDDVNHNNPTPTLVQGLP